MNLLKRMLALVLCLCALAAAACAESNEELLGNFVLRYGDRNSKKVAITVDDCYKNRREWITYDAELCRKYGIQMTFFPIVYTGCLEEAYRDIWLDVLDAGCEIGSHTWSHMKLGNRDAWGLIGALGKHQEALDQTLGFHYQTRWLRPPYGALKGKRLNEQQVIKLLKSFGFDHIVHWEVSETKSLDKALSRIQNGSIMLFHAQKKDSLFLEKLIPELQARGYGMVTVSALFGFDPPETGGEMYVYNKADYEQK